MNILCMYAEVHHDSCGYYLEYRGSVEKDNGEIEELYLPHIDLDMRSLYEETATTKIKGADNKSLDTIKTSCFIADFRVDPPIVFRKKRELLND